jgi:hypothetical protein
MVSPGVHPDRPLTSHGKRAERAEIGGPGEFDHLTDDELERALVERLARLGFALVPAISDGSIAPNGPDTDIT